MSTTTTTTTKGKPMSIIYENRTLNNPQAMPYGDSVISRHRSLCAAKAASEAEWRRYRRGAGRWASSSWLGRVIIRIDDTGETVVG